MGLSVDDTGQVKFENTNKPTPEEGLDFGVIITATDNIGKSAVGSPTTVNFNVKASCGPDSLSLNDLVLDDFTQKSELQ